MKSGFASCLSLVALLAGCAGGSPTEGGPGAPGAPGAPEAPTMGGGGQPGISAGGAGNDTTGGLPPETVDEFGPVPGNVPMRRLTNDEYLASIGSLFPAALFPNSQLPALQFVPDQRVANLRNLSSSQTSTPVRMEQYETSAQMIADAVVLDPTTLTGCDAVAIGEQACGEAYVFDLGKRVFRRPLEDRETTILTTLLQTGPTQNDYAARLSLAIRYLLLSPSFLFRPEVGVTEPGAAEVRALTPHELATRLSYFITGNTPDAELTRAADSGALATADVLRAQADRLLTLPSSQANLTAFHRAWLNTEGVPDDRDAALFPSFDAGIAMSMAEESRQFFQNILFTQAGSMRDLYTAPYTFANGALAGFYGAAPPATPWTRVELNPAQRAGLLTQPAWLIVNGHQDEGSAILRGKFVLGTFLCSSVPPPPPGIVDAFPARDRSLTMRDWLDQQHETQTICGACHGILDPLGLPFEHYDGVGLWRDTDRGMPLDVTGSYTDARSGESITFDGAVEFAQALPDFAPARSCYLSQWFRFGLGRLDSASDPNDLAYLAWLTNGYLPDSPLIEFVDQFASSNGFRFNRMQP